MIAFASLAHVLAVIVEKPLDVASKVGKEERRAFLAKDYAAYQRLLTPDFVSIETTGKRLDKQQAIAVERDARERIVKVESIGSNIGRAWRAEGGILVERQMTLTALFKAKRGKVAVATFTQETQSLLVLQNGGWRIKRTRILNFRWTPGGRKSLV